VIAAFLAKIDIRLSEPDMMKMLVAGFAALSLSAAPVGAAAAPARASAPVTDANALAGGEGGGLIIALIILAGTIFAIMSQEDDDDPDSP